MLPNQLRDYGLGAYHLALTVESTLRIYQVATTPDPSTTYNSRLMYGTCSTLAITDSFYSLIEVTGLPLPPTSIPFGYRVSAA